ncbi:MAG: hypothetical protein ACYS9X_15930 [Planctomycetota bacterium]|jgi:hypothetical protein
MKLIARSVVPPRGASYVHLGYLAAHGMSESAKSANVLVAVPLVVAGAFLGLAGFVRRRWLAGNGGRLGGVLLLVAAIMIVLGLAIASLSGGGYNSAGTVDAAETVPAAADVPAAEPVPAAE